MHDLKAVSTLFDLRGDFVHGYSYGSGHINDTYCIWVDQAGQRIRYILQRVNHNVFKQPIPLMENVKRVTDHALKRLKEEQCPEAYRRTLTLVPSVDGKPYALDSDGNCWRVYPFIERARTYDQIETTKQCQEAARAFGEFQKLTADLPGEPLFETIPNFHNTTSRLAALKEAIQSDPLGRVKEVQKEIDWYLSRESDCHLVVDYLKSGELPLRCTHNDTKLNNILFDKTTGEGLCVIDLDTVMPGLAANDFGDSIRFGANHCAEDEADLSKVNFSMELFEIYTKGFLQAAGDAFTPLEKQTLPWGAKLMTMECGMRFLADYLEGDHYFHINYEQQNLNRARTQFKLTADMERNWDAMQKVIEKYC